MVFGLVSQRIIKKKKAILFFFFVCAMEESEREGCSRIGNFTYRFESGEPVLGHGDEEFGDFETW